MLKRSVKRPRLSRVDRGLWALLSRRWSRWSDALIIVKPATVIKWHRAGFRRYWTWRSRRKGGRPGIDPEIGTLIKRMATVNLWGAPRIHGELLELGIRVSEATVSKYMPRRKKPPSQTWRAFLENHVGTLVSVDFFTVPTMLFNMLFGFVVLAHEAPPNPRHQRDQQPLGGVDGESDRAGLPVGQHTPVPAARPGWHLRRGLCRIAS